MSAVFFTDRDLGAAFPAILVAGGLRVERHADHFAHDCPDEEWLRVIGTRRWIAVTRDTRIRYRPNELAAVMTHRVALLVVVGKGRHARPRARLRRDGAADREIPDAARAAPDREGAPSGAQRPRAQAARTGDDPALAPEQMKPRDRHERPALLLG